MKVLVTGANGFIGKNLVVRLNELENISVSTLVRGDDVARIMIEVADADAVVHLAGENRPKDESAFTKVNLGLTVTLCNAIEHKHKSTGQYTPLIFASSSQAERDNPYGRSKLAAEEAVEEMSRRTGNPCLIFRLPGVFGKWCKPNYNSVVATFCYNMARDLPIQVQDPSISLRLVYVDDVVLAILTALKTTNNGCVRLKVEPEFSVILGDLAKQINAFGKCRSTLMTERTGEGFIRALYATYVSYLPIEKFSYTVPQHADSRGVFVEMLKTPDSGQFSYFTAYPGVTRGGHYHHTKTEKFLVIKGEALFRFRHLLTNELIEFKTCSSNPQVVETIPGWIHDITNIGTDEMFVMIWANENFNSEQPDTFARKI